MAQRLRSDSAEHPSRRPSNSITDHYSMLRSNSSREVFSEEEPQTALLKSTATSASTTSSSTAPLSPKLIPVKKALSIVSKLPSPSTSPIHDGIKHLLRKASISIFQDRGTPPTDGPLTKSFDDVSMSPSLGGLSGDDTLPIDPLMLNSEGDHEIVLESPKIPEVLVTGLPLLRITRKKKVQRTFKIDLDKALVTWSNKTTSRMSLDKIQQIRVADDARNYREEYGVSKELNDRWATILYNELSTNKLKALHIIAPTKQDFDLFLGTLTKLVTRRRELMKYLSVPGENFARIHWKNYVSKDDTSKDLLSFDDVVLLTKRLHINCDREYLSEIFKANDTGNKGALDFPDFQSFVKAMKVRPDVSEIFYHVTNGSDRMVLDRFAAFVRDTQQQDDSDEVLYNLFTKFTETSTMDIEGFTNYLTSTYSSAFSSAPEDLTRPLNEYFISSSHNTYLLGRQYGGNSTSIEGYTRALQRGCRSIEIDIWDGDSGPVVTHGKITSSISVRDVFETVRKYAFIVTPLPLFLSLEIHCKAEYQLLVKEMLIDTFGDMLITRGLLPNALFLPSPLELKHKILVKVKKSGTESSSLQQSSSNSGSLTSSSTALEDSTDDETMSTLRPPKKDKKSLRVIPQLGELGVYASGLKFTNFSLPESKSVNHIFSFSDRSFTSMIKDSEKEYLVKKHNRKYMMRVYPAGYRYKSSNFIPIKPWSYGVQMVATNWQTYDLGQQINEAMFHIGARSGYVLKPSRLRDTQQGIKFKMLASEPATYVSFSIDIISGQLLPRPHDLKTDETLSPYVVFELIEPTLIKPMTITDLSSGATFTSNTACQSTKAIPMNGFNPLWNYRFEGTIKDVKGLNFIRFVVKTGELPFALHCCKLDNLNQGYRHIPLYDLQGEEYIFSTLFVKIRYEIVDALEIELKSA